MLNSQTTSVINITELRCFQGDLPGNRYGNIPRRAWEALQQPCTSGCDQRSKGAALLSGPGQAFKAPGGVPSGSIFPTSFPYAQRMNVEI